MKKIIFRLLTILLGTIIGLLLAEGLVRLLMPNPGAVKAARDLRQNERFLDPSQIPSPKTGQLRIAFLGDSYVYGQGVEFMEIFSNQTGEHLRKRWPGRKIEILNFGRPGANTLEELEIYKNNILQYDPDMVVLGFVLNDFTYSKASWNFSQIYKTEKNKYLIFKRFENISRLAYFLDWTIFQLFSDMNRIHIEYLSNLYNPGKNPKYQEMNAALDELLRLMSQRHGLVLFFPMFVKEEKTLPFYRTALKLLSHSCKKNQVAFIETLAYFQDRAPSYWWASLEDHHPNAAAHAIIARVLSDFILQQKLF
jgi:lysophospholipase L1-like esterase